MSSSSLIDSFKVLREISVGGDNYIYFSLDELRKQKIVDVQICPYSVKVLIESLLRSENGKDVTKDDLLKLLNYYLSEDNSVDIPFKPARVLLQDFTGVPCVVDLASMRTALANNQKRPSCINPDIPVDLVIDHSVQVDFYGRSDACIKNEGLEMERNMERYEFLKWAQNAFNNFRIIPPGQGICHQINTEYLTTLVSVEKVGNKQIVYPDSVIGTDSHTTTVNGMGVVGWGVGGIEAEAVMLGKPLFIAPPPVLGCRLKGRLPKGCFGTDIALTVTEVLRKKGVVGNFVEFFGDGLSNLSVPDRITIANMAPEYGATMGFFPADYKTLEYLRLTGKSEKMIELLERYMKAQGLFRTDEMPEPDFSDEVEIDLSKVRQCVAGPKRPQDRIALSDLKIEWNRQFNQVNMAVPKADGNKIENGSVLIAAITSCTNTGNPRSIIAAGLLAKKAVEKGLTKKPWVKTSLSPGSKTVTIYLKKSGLLHFLEKLGFFVAGYGCMTCIGNSGFLDDNIEKALKEGCLSGVSVVSGNRNFEGRIHPAIKASYLASPALVVAYSLTGTVDIDFDIDPLITDSQGSSVYLKDVMPDEDEINFYLYKYLNRDLFKNVYEDLFSGSPLWNSIDSQRGEVFKWNEKSTYLQKAPFFDNLIEKEDRIKPIINARVLAMFGDSVTTDHISPAGTITIDSPAGSYLIEMSVDPADFNSYGSRRGNHNVMCRGTFANRNLKNMLSAGEPGGITVYLPSGKKMSIYDAAMGYIQNRTPTIVVAGNDYGMGSSRDWAAKGTYLLGVKAVIAQSFERIHRSNLVGMGVLPLQFIEGENADVLELDGAEFYSIALDDNIKPNQTVEVAVEKEYGVSKKIMVLCRLDSEVEINCFRQGGILKKIFREKNSG